MINDKKDTEPQSLTVRAKEFVKKHWGRILLTGTALAGMGYELLQLRNSSMPAESNKIEITGFGVLSGNSVNLGNNTGEGGIVISGNGEMSPNRMNVSSSKQNVITQSNETQVEITPNSGRSR